MPITRVLDEKGNTIHDCAAAGCETSWDGYELSSGDAVENRADPDPDLWEPVDERTVRRIPEPAA